MDVQPRSTASSGAAPKATRRQRPPFKGAAPAADLLHALQAMRRGDFSVRLASDFTGIEREIAETFNEIVAADECLARQLARVGEAVGREGEAEQRARLRLRDGAWGRMAGSIDALIDDRRRARELEKLNEDLEQRVGVRTAELVASTAKLIESERRRSLAIAAGNMGSWDWDWPTGDIMWDAGQYRIFGVDRATFPLTPQAISRLVVPEDRKRLKDAVRNLSPQAFTCEIEFRIERPNGEVRCCSSSAAASIDGDGRIQRVSGVTIDITARKSAEERQLLLAREVDHRARNVLSLVQAIVRLTRAENVGAFSEAVEGRITALARVHTILSLSNWEGAELGALVREELGGFMARDRSRISAAGPMVRLRPATAQTIALAVHELASNALKYGALSTITGGLTVTWREIGGNLQLDWRESSGPRVSVPTRRGFGTRSVIASIETQLGGRVDFDWRPEGLVFRLVVPLRARAEAVSALPAVSAPPVGSLVA